MADVFYFSSPPRKPALRTRTFANKSRVNRKRRIPKMDLSRQHACMARFDEPTFCPSDISSILARYRPLGLDVSGDVDALTPELVEDDEEDDEPGGVSIDLNDIDQDMTDAFVATPVAGWSPGPIAHTTGNSATALHSEHTTLPPGLSLESRHTPHEPHELPVRAVSSSSTAAFLYPSSSSVLGSSHPRPHSQESWEEEDGRRLRFALDGEDTNDIPRFALPEDIASVPEYAPEVTVTHDEAPRVNTSPHGPDITISGRQVDIVAQIPPSTTQPGSSSLDSTLTHHDVRPAPPIDGERAGVHRPAITRGITTDDYLTVDDPRWSYEFADFLDTWRLRFLTGHQVPPVDDIMDMWPLVFSSKHLPEEVSRKEIRSRGVDMQGLDWQNDGSSRDNAMAARVQLHPSMLRPSGLARPASITAEQRKMQAEPTYRFRNFVPKHRAHFSHHQLRNLLAGSSRSDIYFADCNKVYQTSLACPLASNTVMDLSKSTEAAAKFRITCLATSPSSSFSAYRSHNLLLAGGFYGEYALRDVDGNDQSTNTGLVTDAFNGLVTHVHAFTGRRSGIPQAAFCSNDHKLRLMDTSSLSFTKTFAYEHAINCSATSPEGRLRVLVGDSNEAHITDAERGDALITLCGHTDHGFACAWAPNGIHVASGAQDGTTLVWDARNWSQPLQSLASTMSCPRSLHFTDTGSLIVAEDDDIVSIYDAGSFAKQQDIRFFGSIAGVALLDGGAEMAVANVDKRVGGLLSFQRTAQGVHGGGMFGGRAPRGSRRRFETSVQSDFVSDVFV